jgi:hypothetical protein
MRVLVARAGKHSRREYTVSAPLRVVTVTAGGARRIWPRTRPCRASRGGTVCRDMWGGGAPRESQRADRRLVSRLRGLGRLLAAGTAPADPRLSQRPRRSAPGGQPVPTKHRERRGNHAR